MEENKTYRKRKHSEKKERYFDDRHQTSQEETDRDTKHHAKESTSRQPEVIEFSYKKNNKHRKKSEYDTSYHGDEVKNERGVSNNFEKSELKLNHHRAEKIDPSDEDIKFKELIPYYEHILKTLREGLPEESRDGFVSNVLQEGKGYEVRLSSHKFCGHCIELLLSLCDDVEIWMQFMTAFAAEKETVCTNASATHITELLIHFALKKIKNWSSVFEFEEEDSPERKEINFYISWLTEFGDFVVENLTSCLQDQYACHVVCSIVRALGGDTSVEAELMSKKLVNHKKDFREQYIGGQSFSEVKVKVPVILDKVPKFFKKVLKRISKALLNIENIIDYVTFSPSAAAIEALLFILKKRLPKKCKKLILGLSTSIFSQKNQEGIPHAFLHKNCSYVVEKIFQAADEESQCQLWDEYFQSSLETLIAHPVGNFVLQRLFDVVESKTLFETMSEKIGACFGLILVSRRNGVFLSISGACNRLKTQQAQFMKNIMQCLKCDEPEDRQLQLVPLLLGLRPNEATHSIRNEEGSAFTICLQGSLLVQEVLKFQKPIKVVKSLLNMKPQEIAYIACHMQGCHVLNAFFSNIPVGEKNKDKLIQNIKPVLVSLACDRNGSLTLSRIWILLSIKQRGFIAEFLSKKENSSVLQSNQNSNILLKKFGIFHFTHNRDKWKEIQSNVSHSNTQKTRL